MNSECISSRPTKLSVICVLISCMYTRKSLFLLWKYVRGFSEGFIWLGFSRPPWHHLQMPVLQISALVTLHNMHFCVNTFAKMKYLFRSKGSCKNFSEESGNGQWNLVDGWMDANTHNDNITNNNKQDGLDFTQLYFLLNIYEKKRQHFLQLLVVLLSETRRSDFGSARAQVKQFTFFSISPPTATVAAAI